MATRWRSFEEQAGQWLSATLRACRGQEVDSGEGTELRFLQFRELEWSPGGETAFHAISSKFTVLSVLSI